MPLPPADTLVCDTALLSRFQHDAAYDYGRELTVEQNTLMEWLAMKVGEMMRAVLGSSADVVMSRPVMLALGVVTLAVVLWFLYRHQPQLFSRQRKVAMDYAVEQETIYGIDFDEQIRQARSRADWHAAVRYTYLKVLRQLSDAGLIDWQLSKTPSRYVQEWKSAEFSQLTNHFLRVRYGNFEATEALYSQVEQLAAAIARKGGAR